MRIALLGSEGYVGSAFDKYLLTKNIVEVIKINRKNFLNLKLYKNKFDCVIHSAMPSKRFISNNNPEIDRKNTLEITKFFLTNLIFEQFILISTLSVRTEVETAYGKNRQDVEDMILKIGGKVVRFGPLFGGKPRDCTLKNILMNQHVFYSRDTRYGFTDVNWCAEFVIKNTDNLDSLTEVGATNSVSLETIKDRVVSNSTFGTKNDSQMCLDFSFGPNAENVLNYVDEFKNKVAEVG